MIGNIVPIIIFIACIVLATFAVLYAIKKRMEERKEKRQEQLDSEKRLAEIQQENEEKRKQVNLLKDTIVRRHGLPDKKFVIKEDDLDKEVWIYLSDRIAIIQGKEYAFDSFVKCDLSDDTIVRHGKTIIRSNGNSSTKNGNMIGRAVVGGLVAGGAGAVIGGSTASRHTTNSSVVSQGDDIVIHDYTIWITFKDIINPLVKIQLGDKEDLARELEGAINAIIACR